ncbi:MAG TPA: HEAT repeat domain-containing protein [Polyangiaceae bacterium]|jgi:HEAT repeat protein
MRRLGLGLFLLLGSCSTQPPVRTALYGDLPSLKRDIASAQRANKLNRGAVVDLARALDEREVMSASGSDGAARVGLLRPCAHALESTIERRAEAGDDVAAELTLMLLELHAADRVSAIKHYAESSSGAWRAVAARAAGLPRETELRKRFFTDPDERARRAAFASAHEAREPSELEALLEAARLDPDPQSQTLAARAAGAIGGERAVLALKDLWTNAEDALRIGIVDAWSEPGSLPSGGARELAAAAEANSGLASVSASFALTRLGGSDAQAANARLRRYIADGSDDEKRLALSVAPLDDENIAALVDASKKASPELRAVALARLANVAKTRTEAILALRNLANTKPTSAAEEHAQAAAVSALAEAGDPSVHATLVKNLSDKDSQTRRRAAEGLTDLGDYSNAASALGDDDANLRSGVACEILARERKR